MKSIKVIYHSEPEGRWWADSPDTRRAVGPRANQGNNLIPAQEQGTRLMHVFRELSQSVAEYTIPTDRIF